MFRVLATIRTPVLMFIVVPLSFARWAFRSVREIYRTKTRSQNKEDIAAGHEQRILSVIQQIQEWNKRGRPKPLRTARPNWAAMSTKLSSNKEACELISVTI
jgi:hypothetical protein